MTAYYNEIDPGAAQWLRNLIEAGHIAPGIVDTRSIEDITADDLKGFTQVHFFAGIGVWSYALRCAGWPDDRPVWTGSCPCQPFSTAGKRKGLTDERHLWPAMFHLIEECRPGVVFGEQVASKDGLQWLDTVQTDLEGAGYAAAAVDLCAAGFGAPHIRQRLYWVAHSDRAQHWRALPGSGGEAAAVRQPEIYVPSGQPGGTGRGNVFRLDDAQRQRQHARGNGDHSGDDGQQLSAACEGFGVGNTNGAELEARQLKPGGSEPESERASQSGLSDGMADRFSEGSQGGLLRWPDSQREAIERYIRRYSAANDLAYSDSEQHEDRDQSAGKNHSQNGSGATTESTGFCGAGIPGPVNGFWGSADWIFCRDGKWRAVEPGAIPLVDGATARVVRLRAYGNAIVAPVAEAFITSYLEAANDESFDE